MKCGEKDGETKPHAWECRESEPSAPISHKVGDDRREDADQHDDNAGNDTTKDTIVSNVAHLTLDESSKTLFQHSSSLVFDGLE